MKPPTPNFQPSPPSSPRRGRCGSPVPKQGGQVLLAVLLIMVVVTVIALSIATRTVTNLRITSQTEQSQRAFSAAEAGIEQGLKTLTPTAGTNITVEPNLSALYALTELKTYELYVPKNEVAQIDLNGLVSANKVDIFWVCNDLSKPSCSSEMANKASIVVHEYRNPSGTVVVTNRSYCDAQGRSPVLNFNCLTVTTAGYNNGIQITLAESPKLLRIRPLYNGVTFLVRGNNVTLPTQAYDIQSTGTSSGGNSIVRKIKVVRTLPTIPAVFDYGLYSGVDISK